MSEESGKQLITITDIWGSKHQVEKHYLDNPDMHNIPIEKSDPNNQMFEQGTIQRTSIRIKEFIGYQVASITGIYYQHSANQVIRYTDKAGSFFADATLNHSDPNSEEPTWELRQIPQGQIENPDFI